MNDDLKPYSKCEESDLPWLGKVPTHWDVARTKRHFRLRTEKSGTDHGRELLSIYTHIGVRPRKDLEQKGNRASTTNDYWIVKRGDIIVNKLLTWMGAIGVSHYDGVTSPAYDVLKSISEEVEPDYYHYLFRTGTYLQQFKSRSRGIMDMRLRLYFDQFGQIPIPVPPRPEQQAIVRFLDAHSRRVNQFVRSRRRLIEVLNEQKQAIINETVTRGLHQSGRYKPSGNPWIGEIPQAWECKRLKNLAELRVSNVDKHTKVGEIPVRLCNYTDVYKNAVITADMPFMAATATPDEITSFHIEVGDVIITKDSEDWHDIGVPALVAETADDLVCGYHLAILRPRPKVMSGRFLAYLMQCKGVSTQLSLAANGVTRYGLSHGAIKAISLPIAPFEEQEPLSDRIDEATATVSTAISRVNREIDLIHEYRTRLITDVVTGKLDVRHLAPPSGEVELDNIEAEELLDDELDGVEEGDLAEEALNADD
jgi:type I restriction enzyme S subunit